MIDSGVLLSALQRQLGLLLDDLRDRVENEPAIGDPLRAEYDAAFAAERTGRSFTDWSEDRLNIVAVGWLLACVFVRFGEDTGLIDDAMLAGVGPRGDEARAAQQDFFRANPHASDRDYLHHVFRSAARLPGLGGVLDELRNPLWQVDPSADACSAMLQLFRRTDDDGTLVLDFTDPTRDTRFLGDLYQDLSAHAKATYALLQTPVFVEEFILDRTLDPAIEAFGLPKTSLIDPTCGSGHFLLGALARLLERWRAAEPATNERELTQRALDAVWGVDLNPFAADIARFRLLVAALDACGIDTLRDAPDFTIHVAVGDSLLWGARNTALPGLEAAGADDDMHLYASEDADALRATFDRSYAAVVGNPPYITVKDKALNEAYRLRYGSCHREYSLGVPFTELFFNLAIRGGQGTAGFVGMITANSFMKQMFGARLVEQYLPRWDLTHVIDTSGAYIPGHGTPTVILFGRHQPPVADKIRSVMGIRGEPSTPSEPSKGRVWTAVFEQIDQPGSQSDFVSVSDTPRERLATHPWSIGGGGAAELKEQLDVTSSTTLGDCVSSVGFGAITGEDNVYAFESPEMTTRLGLNTGPKLGIGENLRDWGTAPGLSAVWPYDRSFTTIELRHLRIGTQQHLWRFRECLLERKHFGVSIRSRGTPWWQWRELYAERLRSRLSIAFASVATHNHFILNKDGTVFKQSAPMIKLHKDSTIQEHLGLVALLNSSVALFWMKQVFQRKTQMGGGGGSASVPFSHQYDLKPTTIERFPLPDGPRPVVYGERLDSLASELSACQPSSVAEREVPTLAALDAARADVEHLQAEMVTWQEELDWHCYQLYNLTTTPLTVSEGHEPPPLRLGERAFEIILARRVAAGDVETAWFTRHNSTPITELPAHWPDWYRDLVERRIALIESDRNIGLIERPEHKRRWQRTAWDTLEQAALRDWLLDRLEDGTLWFNGERAECRSVAQLADRISTDDEWMSVARLWAGQTDINPASVVADLVADEHVPAQAAARYKPSGMTKRAEWERVWDLQRAEDRGEDVDKINVPPKYASSDFRKTSYWRQRGKLDVPKERFTSVIGAERDAASGDDTMILAWAGFDHAQLAQALATLLGQRQTVDGWNDERIVPILAALDEVLPWVHQWHPDVDPGLGQTLGDFYDGIVAQGLATISATTTTLSDWQPPATTRGRKKKASA